MKVLGASLTAVLIFAIVSHHPHHPHRSHRFLVARRIAHGLRDTPLRGLAFEFEAAGWKERLSPYFLVGAAGTESSLGAAPCQNNPRNIWGLGSCGSNWNVPYFQTWRQAIEYFARFVRRHWPRAHTVYDLYGYCVCGVQAWGDATAAWMRRLFNVDISLDYPH